MGSDKDRWLLSWKGSKTTVRYVMANYDGNIWLPTSKTSDLAAADQAGLTPLPAGWEDGISKTLTFLFQYQPFATAKAVQAGIDGAATRVMIIPESVPGVANTAKTDIQAATPLGEQPYEKCHSRPYDPRDRSTWDHCQIDPSLGKGTGTGSQAVVEFTADSYKADKGPGSRPDELLLHELVHAMRMMRGVHNKAPMRVIENGGAKLIFGDIEEFLAVLVTNIHRAEAGRKDLRADHTNNQTGQFRTLVSPLTDAKAYYKEYKAEIDRLRSPKAMNQLYQKLAAVQSPFNPIYHAVFPTK